MEANVAMTSHRYYCPTCSKGFDIYTTYYCHKKRHDAPTKQCSFCPKAFHTNMLLNAHLWKCAKQQVPSSPPTTVSTVTTPVEQPPQRRSLMPFMFSSTLY